MYLYGVSGGVARGNLVSGYGSGVDIWDNGGGYSGYLVWRSGADLPGYYGDVIFRITPRDNDPNHCLLLNCPLQRHH